MKRKLLSLILTALVVALLAGCGTTDSGATAATPTPELEEMPSGNLTEQELTIDFSFGSRTGIYSGEIDDNGLPNGQGKFTSENPTGETWTYEGDWVAGHWEGNGTCTWSNGQVYSGDYINDSETGYGTLTLETGERYEGTFISGSISGDGTYTLPTGERYEGSFVSGAVYGDGTLYYPDEAYFIGSFTDLDNATGEYCDKDGTLYEAAIKDGELLLRPLVDFFSDEERQQKYEELYKSYQYSALVDYVNEYISENSPSLADSAYVILEITEPILPFENNFIIDFDDFDETYSICFPGATEISGSNSVVVTVKEKNVDAKLGFRKTGWLFFDEIQLSVNGEIEDSAHYKSYDVERNVISGRTIEEYVYYNFDSDFIEKLEDAQAAIIRFINRDTKETYDHTLTENEINALCYGKKVEKTNILLSNILYYFNKDIDSYSNYINRYINGEKSS